MSYTKEQKERYSKAPHTGWLLTKEGRKSSNKLEKMISNRKEVAKKMGMIDYEKGREKILSKWSKKALAKRNAVPEVSSHSDTYNKKYK